MVDDASEDETQSVVKSFNDERIEYIRHPANRGETVARNAGVSNARADFVADDDDEWLPEKQWGPDGSPLWHWYWQWQID